MIEFGLGASGEENENVRALYTDRRTHRQKDTRTDDGQQAIRRVYLSF